MKNEIKIGILATVSILTLLLGINFLKGKDLFSKSFSYQVEFTDATGLQKSTPVYYRGFKVGKIKDIIFDDSKGGKIITYFDVSYDLKLKEGSKAVISSTDLLGSKGLVILNNEAEQKLLSEGGMLIGEQEQSLTASITPIKDKAESVISRIDTLVANLNQLTSANNQRKINQALASTANITHQIDQLLAKESQRLDQILASASSIASNLEKNNALISKTLQNVATVSDSLAKADLNGVIVQAREALAQTQIMLKKVNSGQGTLGQLVNDDKLYKNLTQSAQSLDKLLIDLRENPSEYIHFSVFGKKSKKSE